jgi:hypothetical protein
MRKLRGEPFPQVALRRKNEVKWRWFLESELDASSELQAYRTICDVQFAYPRDDSTACERLTQKLKQLGINNEFKTELFEPSGNPVEAWAESAIDDVILRGVGKIAFNYLAFNYGAQFCLRDDFDAFRNYVRRGEPPNAGFVVFSRNSRKTNQEWDTQSNGHTVILGWNADNNNGIVCLVTLFGHLTYHALLCSRYSGAWFPLATAHSFDIRTRLIVRLC